MRKVPLVNNEFYHVYNRGVEKRYIFCDEDDFQRFLQSIHDFNTKDPIGSIYEKSFRKQESFGSSTSKSEDRLVDIVAYCLNPNHFHLILRQNTDKGIEKFMQRLGTGYTKYFNHKHRRTGGLLQGKFKSSHIDTTEYLLHLSVYVNLNYKVHQLGSRTSKSSWGEYTKDVPQKMVSSESILARFKNKMEYRLFAEETLRAIQEKRLLREEF